MEYKNKKNRIILNFSRPTLLLIFGLASCESIPPGEPPLGGIIAEQIHQPANKKYEKTKKEAIDYAITSIATVCTPLSSAPTSNPPPVINDFIASSERKINYMPIDLWNALIKMKMIRPVTSSNEAKYILHSEFLITDEESPLGKIIIWKIKLCENPSEIDIWQENIKFIIE